MPSLWVDASLFFCLLARGFALGFGQILRDLVVGNLKAKAVGEPGRSGKTERSII